MIINKLLKDLRIYSIHLFNDRPIFLKHTKKHNIIGIKMLDINAIIYTEICSLKKTYLEDLREDIDLLLNEICSVDSNLYLDVLFYYEMILDKLTQWCLDFELYEVLINVNNFRKIIQLPTKINE